ncbi:hypothetical protein DAKH74_010160 [Maudiozyma humilis]|uniref:Uncharacterized protein n=1 Tax=Maudiozyma humilis TaxID=51915 RepID=A0AAV5RSB5_MAUHU|nr:hypothetical protein DAKH74_010160 [Kazachstania humilis]
MVGRRGEQGGMGAADDDDDDDDSKKSREEPQEEEKNGQRSNGQQSTRRGMAWKRRLCRPITNGAHNTAHTPHHQRSQHSHKEEKATRQPHDVSYAQQPP